MLTEGGCQDPLSEGKMMMVVMKVGMVMVMVMVMSDDDNQKIITPTTPDFLGPPVVAIRRTTLPIVK